MKFRHTTSKRPMLAAIHNEVLAPLMNGQPQTVDVVELDFHEAPVLAAELNVQQLPSTLSLPYQLKEGEETQTAKVTLKVVMPDEMHIDDYEKELANGEATDSTTA